MRGGESARRATRATREGAQLDLRRERARRLEAKLRHELGREILEALEAPRVVEVMLNADGSVWLDRLGEGLVPAPFHVEPERAENLLGTVASLLGTVVHEKSPLLEGELPGFDVRFQGVTPPVSPRPVFALRKHARRHHCLDDYVREGRLEPGEAGAIRDAVRRRQNLVVCGGTSSGKTTLANAILAEKVALGDPNQRIVILEDTVELQCAAPNTIQLRTSPEVDLRQLVRATLRLRPDSIVVGEVRGREALELLKAWNTGHPGGITTLHANDGAASLSRLDQLVQEAGVPSQPELIAEAVDWIVTTSLSPEGRRVTEVLRLQGYERRHGRYRLERVA